MGQAEIRYGVDLLELRAKSISSPAEWLLRYLILRKILPILRHQKIQRVFRDRYSLDLLVKHIIHKYGKDNSANLYLDITCYFGTLERIYDW